MADTASLKDFPGDFGESFLPYKTSLRQRRRAKQFSNESYIGSVKLFKGGEGEIHVKARVFRSQRKNEEPHSVTLTVETDKISVTHCSCTAGAAGECAHVLAVVFKVTDWILEGLSEIPNQPACTSMAQQWDRPRGSRKIRTEPVSLMVIAKPGNTTRKKRPLTADFQDNRKIQLLDSDIDYLKTLDCPIGYLACQPFQTMMTEHGPQNVSSALGYQLPLLQPVGPSNASTPCADLTFCKQSPVEVPEIAHDLSEVQLTNDQATQLELNTKNQSENDNWHKERKTRLTASNFGRFMLRKAPVTKKLVDSICNPKPFTSKPTSYGHCSESIAKTMYRNKTNNHVHDCGLVVNPAFPYLGASPDGKVCDGGMAGILEVKCPFLLRDMTFLEALQNVSLKTKICLEKIGENIQLKENHVYWFQVQGQLLVTGAAFCDFVVYTRQDLLIQRIVPKVPVMKSILDKMSEVFNKFL